MTATPIYAQTPIFTAIAISATANTSRATSVGVPTSGVLISPNTNTNGIRVDQINVFGQGTTLAGQIIIWKYDGTNAYPVTEITVSVVVPTTTSVGFYTSLIPVNFVLQAGDKLYATSQVASQLVAVGINGGAF